MDGSLKDLSKYRLERAEEDLKTAADNLSQNSLRASVNRSYYAIFHALRAVTAMDGFDSGKHSGIIAYINRNYVKTDVFDRSFSKLIDMSFRLCEKADYEDFYEISFEEAEAQLQKSLQVVQTVRTYLKERWNNHEKP